MTRRLALTLEGLLIGFVIGVAIGVALGGYDMVIVK